MGYDGVKPFATAMAAAEHECMGTWFTHQAHGERAAEAVLAARREAERLETMLSRYSEDGDVGRLNAAAGGAPVPVAPETFRVLLGAEKLARSSGGLFDISIAPLSDVWDFRRAEMPESAVLERARALTGFRFIALDQANGKARITRKGRAIDLGGIAKGFAGDELMGVFGRFGIRSALSNLGGGVSTLGARPDGALWRIGIRNPRGNGLIGAVSVEGRAVITSGDYERCFFAEGRRCHHLIDPRTGYPADSGLISATVVADSGMEADALSTAVFVAGLERGLAMIGKSDGAGAVLIDKRLRAYVTRNLLAGFEGVAGLEIFAA